MTAPGGPDHVVLLDDGMYGQIKFILPSIALLWEAGHGDFLMIILKLWLNNFLSATTFQKNDWIYKYND